MNAWNSIVSNLIPYRPEHDVKPVLYPKKHIMFLHTDPDSTEES